MVQARTAPAIVVCNIPKVHHSAGRINFPIQLSDDLLNLVYSKPGPQPLAIGIFNPFTVGRIVQDLGNVALNERAIAGEVIRFWEQEPLWLIRNHGHQVDQLLPVAAIARGPNRPGSFNPMDDFYPGLSDGAALNAVAIARAGIDRGGGRFHGEDLGGWVPRGQDLSAMNPDLDQKFIQGFAVGHLHIAPQLLQTLQRNLPIDQPYRPFPPDSPILFPAFRVRLHAIVPKVSDSFAALGVAVCGRCAQHNQVPHWGISE